jgi:hypothetical protein
MMPIITYASVQSSSPGKNITKSATQIFEKHALTASQKSLGEIRLGFSFFINKPTVTKASACGETTTPTIAQVSISRAKHKTT